MILLTTITAGFHIVNLSYITSFLMCPCLHNSYFKVHLTLLLQAPVASAYVVSPRFACDRRISNQPEFSIINLTELPGQTQKLFRHYVLVPANMAMAGDAPSFDDLWNSALSSYLGTTNRTSEERKLLTGLHSPEDLSAKLEADKTKFGAFREKHSKIYKALVVGVRPFMTLADVAQSVISSTPIAPASTILGAALFLVKSAEGVSDAYDSIESLFERLTSFSLRLDEYVGAGMNSSLQRNAIDILTCLLEVLARAEHVVKEGRWKKYLGVTLLGKDDKVQGLLQKLESLFVEEERLVVAITYATNQRVEKTTTEGLAQTKEMTSKIDDLTSLVQGAKFKPSIPHPLNS